MSVGSEAKDLPPQSIARSLSAVADVHVAMDVRISSEVPNHAGSFELPHVPNPIVANILLLEVGETQILQALSLYQLHGFLGIGLPERRKQILHHSLHEGLLILGQIPNSDSG